MSNLAHHTGAYGAEIRITGITNATSRLDARALIKQRPRHGKVILLFPDRTRSDVGGSEQGYIDLSARSVSLSEEHSEVYAVPESPIQSTLEQLEEFAKLGPDWDSYGAEPISALAIARAGRILSTIYSQFGKSMHNPVQPFAAPLADGGVQIEWEKKPLTVDVQIAPEGTVSYLYIEGEEPHQTYQEEHDVPLSKVIDLVTSVLHKG